MVRPQRELECEAGVLESVGELTGGQLLPRQRERSARVEAATEASPR